MGPNKITAFLICDCASAFYKPLNILKKSRPQTKKDKNLIDKIIVQLHLLIPFEKFLNGSSIGIFYFPSKNLIDTRQHGLMKGRATTSNHVTITQFISESINKNS